MGPQLKTLIRTPLTAQHETLGARMIEFAGFLMPLQYTSVVAEHTHTRSAVSLFDVSHMGEIEIKGNHAFPFLQKMVTVDLLRLKPSTCMYGLLCYEHGGTVDDCFIYCFNANRFWLVVNAANIAKDVAWLRDHASKFGVAIRDLSQEKAKLDLQGPYMEKIASRFCSFPISLMGRFDMVDGRFATFPAVISRSGYTGEDGIEIYFDAVYANLIWNEILECDPRVKPAGLGARDTLRIEACYSLYGHELSEHISPVEAGIPWAVHERKADDFIGKAILTAQKINGTAKTLHAFTMSGRAVPREGYEIFSHGKKVGYVSSGTYSPTLGKAIGLGFTDNTQLTPGDDIE
ncbi:MAG TPA: glycine cleavage system aminomethyltransferase GcvT, partial [Spirochaetia bacterium]|nr:glycine cleavage system aminomethyltransferase GcvT [Spirochaetia bacterium]